MWVKRILLYSLRKNVPFFDKVSSYEPRNGKTCSCTCESKSSDQLFGDRTADQRICFRYIDSTIPLLPKSEISSL